METTVNAFIYGQPGARKTTLMGSIFVAGLGRVLYISTDLSYSALFRPELHQFLQKTYYTPNGKVLEPIEDPAKPGDLNPVHGKLMKTTDIAEIIEIFEGLPEYAGTYGAVVLDTLTAPHVLSLDAQMDVPMKRNFEGVPMKPDYGIMGARFTRLATRVQRVIEAGINVFFTARGREDIPMDPNTGEMLTRKARYSVAMNRAAKSPFYEWFDIVAYMEVNGGRHIFQIDQEGKKYEAVKDRTGVLEFPNEKDVWLPDIVSRIRNKQTTAWA